LNPILNVVNFVATTELNQSVDLIKLTEATGFVYNPSVYHCAYFKDRDSGPKVSVFASGKLICVGARKFSDTQIAFENASRRLAELGLVEDRRVVSKLQNIVATSDLGQTIDLEILARKLPRVIYEPEQFPGAIYFPDELNGACVSLFANGKVVLAGLKTPEMIEVGNEVLLKLAAAVRTAA
jgi:transcription initiation factor TFIID TATA-box-binding protein